MSIQKNTEKIVLYDKNGSTLLIVYLSIFSSVALSIILIFGGNDRIAVFAVWLMFSSFTIWMLYSGYYQIITDIDKLSQRIVIKKKRLGRKFHIVHSLNFSDVSKVLYLWQLNDHIGGGRWSAILYLEVNPESKRIKIYSQPSRKTYGHKDPIGPLDSEGLSLAEFIGVDFEILEGLQALDS